MKMQSSMIGKAVLCGAGAVVWALALSCAGPAPARPTDDGGIGGAAGLDGRLGTGGSTAAGGVAGSGKAGQNGGLGGAAGGTATAGAGGTAAGGMAGSGHAGGGGTGTGGMAGTLGSGGSGGGGGAAGTGGSAGQPGTGGAGGAMPCAAPVVTARQDFETTTDAGDWQIDNLEGNHTTGGSKAAHPGALLGGGPASTMTFTCGGASHSEISF